MCFSLKWKGCVLWKTCVSCWVKRFVVSVFLLTFWHGLALTLWLCFFKRACVLAKKTCPPKLCSLFFIKNWWYFCVRRNSPKHTEKIVLPIFLIWQKLRRILECTQVNDKHSGEILSDSSLINRASETIYFSYTMWTAEVCLTHVINSWKYTNILRWYVRLGTYRDDIPNNNTAQYTSW